MANVKTVPYVKQMIGGKFLPDSYDWTNDPNGYKKDEHLPADRCYHCGYKFVGSQYAAFCNICDGAMSMGDDISLRIGDKTTGHLVMRSQLVASRIRIPEDIATEEQYKKKLEEPPKSLRAEFIPADQVV